MLNDDDDGRTHYYGDGCADDHGRADHPSGAYYGVHHIEHVKYGPIDVDHTAADKYVDDFINDVKHQHKLNEHDSHSA